MPTVIFRLKYPSASESVVMLDVSYDAYRLRCSTGVAVPSADFKKLWQSKKNQLNPNMVHSDHYQRLRRVKNLVEEYYTAQTKEGVVPSPEAVKSHLKRSLNMAEKQTENEFIKRFEEYIQYKTGAARTSIVVYRQVLNDLTVFAQKKGKTLAFRLINMAFVDEYVYWLQNKPNENANSKSKTGLLNDTIHKRLRNLKTFMKWAHLRGYHNSTAYQQIKSVQSSKNEIVVLSEYEFDTLKNADLSSRPALERTRDVFVFACCTGQRWSDVEAFNGRDVKREDNGGDADKRVWEFTAVKTKKPQRVPLVGFAAPALQVLEKYDYVLPIVSMQRFNDHLKELGKLLGFDEPVVIKRYSGKRLVEIAKPKYDFMSSHMARRTCVTLLLQRGVPPTTIMKLTGHTDLSTLMKYERTSNDALGDALEMASERKENTLKKVS